MGPYTELIDKYLRGELSEKEKLSFEKELSANTALRDEFEKQKKIIKGIEQLGMRTEISAAVKSAKNTSLIKKITAGILVAGILALGIYYLTDLSEKRTNNNVLYELNENGKAEWSEADKTLKAQVFEIDPSHDTIIETEKGIIFQIQANSFLDGDGKSPSGTIDVEIKEAMTGYDIMSAGLSTTSNGKLLETGGMFYLNVRDGDKSLSIDPGKAVKVHVPATTDKQMSLFKGERKSDGSINWIDPKKMIKTLSTVNILDLDFYPENFLDTLETMGFDIQNKRLTDSIYYSLAVSQMYSYSSGEEGSVTKRKAHAAGSSMRIPDGAELFKKNCAVCHEAHSNKTLTGPGLAGLEKRVPGHAWAKDFTMNSEKMIRAGDPYAIEVYKKFGKASMTVFEGVLSNQEVESILHYIYSGPKPLYKGPIHSETGEIQPSRIKAIWDEKFNNTFLATKEFEQRLKVIFQSCDAGLFNLYVENIDKNLYELDSVAIDVTSGVVKERFKEFFKRKDGGVPVSDQQNKQLQVYLREKQKIYQDAINRSLEKMYSEEQKLQRENDQKISIHLTERINKESGLLFEEIDLNMKEAYRQLGKTKPASIAATNYYSSDVITTGWMNVDMYVIASTINRTTLDYTDKETGKKAVIEYQEVQLQIANVKEFDKIVCYLLPDKLSSFQLIKDSAGVYREKLNQTFEYSIITIGYKGIQTYYDEIRYAKPKQYKIKLKEIDSETLTRRINSKYSFTGTSDLIKDIDFTIFEKRERSRIDVIQKREDIRNRLFRLIYPCYVPAQQAPATPLYEETTSDDSTDWQ